MPYGGGSLGTSSFKAKIALEREREKERGRDNYLGREAACDFNLMV